MVHPLVEAAKIQQKGMIKNNNLIVYNHTRPSKLLRMELVKTSKIIRKT